MKPSPRYSELMSHLLSEMKIYGSDDDIPVGALIVDENYQIISKAFNCRIKNNDQQVMPKLKQFVWPAIK